MQDRWDVAGLVGCMTGRMLETRNVGQEGYRTGGMQDMRD